MIDWHDPNAGVRQPNGLPTPVPPRLPSNYGRLLHRPEPSAPLLREHVDSILAASAVPADERDDVAEELYGHLYERWRAGVHAGADTHAAAREAIAAFGGPATVGPELTSAFHSRLYASTIGVLLPAGVSDAAVFGYGRAVTFLGLSVLGDLLVVGLLAAFVGPLWAVLGIVACLYHAGLSVLAIRALGRGQAWAETFVRLNSVAYICGAVLGAFLSGPASVPGFALGIVLTVWVLAGTSVHRSNSERAGRRRLHAVVVATTLVAYVVSAAAMVAPDPTQASATDLSLTVAASCPASGPWSVTARLRWTKADALGGRLLPVLLNDELGLSIGRTDVGETGFPGDASPWFDDDVSGGDLVDTATGATIPAGLSPGNKWSTPPAFYIGNRRLTIDPRAMQAGTTYQTTFVLPGAAADAVAGWGSRDGRFRVRYRHLVRWGLEAVAECGQTVTARPVAPR